MEPFARFAVLAASSKKSLGVPAHVNAVSRWSFGRVAGNFDAVGVDELLAVLYVRPDLRVLTSSDALCAEFSDDLCDALRVL